VPSIDRFLNRDERCQQLMQRSADWVLHGLLDSLVDDYLPIVDALDETIDRLEAEVLAHAEQRLLQEILLAKRNSLRLRRATTPQRDIMTRLARNEFPKLIRPETSIYFRDIYDHLVRIEYLIEAVRDLSDSALQTYLSVVSNRLNEIMKVLTAGGAIFFPLTLISGIYGMNFTENQLPSFDWEWGFPFVTLMMILVALGLLYYFRRRGWI
jgi:magnesium transporter